MSLYLSSPALAECKYEKYEKGHFWCNERFHHAETKHQIYDDLHLRAARRGYMYVLAAALAMQSDDEACHYFGAPARLNRIERPKPDRGFEVALFELAPTTGESGLEAIVVAFAGTNQARDWTANVKISGHQYERAREYVEQVASRPQYAGVPLVTAGFSLGGGLAIHAAKHPETMDLVAEVWAMNPSPVTRADRKPDRRIWQLSMDREVLKSIRRKVGRLGAPPSQTAEGYYLVKRKLFSWSLSRAPATKHSSKLPVVT